MAGKKHVVSDEVLDQWILDVLEAWAPGESAGYIYLWRSVTADQKRIDQGSLSVSVQRITSRYEELIRQGRIFKTSRGHVIGPSERERREANAEAAKA